MRTSKPAFAWSVLSTAQWLRKNKIQIINTHSSRDGWICGLAARLAKTPFLLRTRHIDVIYPNRQLSQFAFTSLCDHLLTTSQKIADAFLSTFGLGPERVTVLPTGIDVNQFAPAGPKAPLLSSPGSSGYVYIPQDTRMIGMVSVLRSWKGHRTFLEAARQLLDSGFKAHFVIVGEGPIRHKILNQIAELKLDSAVTLTGHREDIPEVLRALDALVIPSTRHEGVPQIGLQALACQTPVVGSDIGGIPEIIQPGRTGRIFPALEAAALAAAIQETFADPALTARFLENGRALVVEKYSLQRMLDILDDLYRRYLSA